MVANTLFRYSIHTSFTCIEDSQSLKDNIEPIAAILELRTDPDLLKEIQEGYKKKKWYIKLKNNLSLYKRGQVDSKTRLFFLNN